MLHYFNLIPSQDGSKAVCECDDTHIVDPKRPEACVQSTVRLGEPCHSSKQCAKWGAKCR